MTRLEQIGGIADFNGVFVNRGRIDQGWLGKAFTVASSENKGAEGERAAIGSHVDQFGSPVGIGRIALRVKDDADRTGHLDRVFQWRAGETEHITAHFDLPLVVRAPGDDMR